MRVLILGGNRFIGAGLAARLATRHKVDVFNRSGTGPEGVGIIQGDRNEIVDLDKINFNRYKVVIDFCLFKPEQFELIRSRVRNKYIFISSAAAYSDSSRLMFNPDMPADGLSAYAPYGKEKADCEKLIHNTELDYLIIRPPYIDGPNSHRPRLGDFVNRLKKDLPINIDGDGSAIMSFVWSEDIVQALYTVVTRGYPSRTVMNAVGGEHYRVTELINTLGKILRKEPQYEFNNSDSIYPNVNLVLTPGALFTFFDKPFIKRLPEYLDWYNNNAKDKYGYN